MFTKAPFGAVDSLWSAVPEGDRPIGLNKHQDVTPGLIRLAVLL